MELTFEEAVLIGNGHTPQAIHDRNNRLLIIYLKEDGLVYGLSAYPEMGDYTDLVFKKNGRISPDTLVSKMSFKKVPHFGGYGFWSAEGDHRFVIYMMETDISDALVDGEIKATVDSKVTSMSLSLINIQGRLLHKDRAIVTPGTKVEVYFTLGDLSEIQLGVFYVDSASVKYPDEDISVSGRNAIGKLLKEQTFDEDTDFTEDTLQDNFKAILDMAGVEEYFVGDPQKTWKIRFDRDLTLLEGIEKVVDLMSGWQIAESAGVIGIGRKNDTRFEQPAVYSFVRDKNCWSYSIEFDDADAQGKVCVYTEGLVDKLQSKAERLKELISDEDKTQEEIERINDLVDELNVMFPGLGLKYTASTDKLNMKISTLMNYEGAKPITVYKDVDANKWWSQPSHRTLYLKVAEGTSASEITEIAEELAEALAISGRMETFAGIFTPQLSIGDEIRVTDENEETETVGTITDLTQTFGKSGFYTSFSVDSGGRKGKPRLTDLISKANKSSDTGGIQFIGVSGGGGPEHTELEITAAVKIMTIDGRDYSKAETGMALVASVYTGYEGPLLVSKTAAAVSYSTCGRTFTSQRSVTYNGETWYYSDTGYFMGGHPTPSYSITGFDISTYTGTTYSSNYEQAVIDLLDYYYGVI